MTVRWALLGPGRHAARSVVPEMMQASDTALVAVLSRDRARGEAFAQRHGIATVHTAFEDVLRDRAVDALYDATPDGLHASHAIAAAAAGKHVLVEKPLALSVAEGAAAIAACRRHGVQFGVVFNQRHEPAHREARRLVREGAIGDVALAYVPIPLRAAAPPPQAGNWRADPAMRPGGIVISIGDHACDTLAYVVGQEIEEVACFSDATRAQPPNERVAGMMLKLSRGAVGYAAASFRTPFARRPFEIHGTEGSMIIENSYAYLTGADGDGGTRLTLVTASGSHVQHFAPEGCFRREIEQFNRAIAGGGAPMTPPEDGLRALAIGAALYAARNSGRVARVAAFLPTPG
jgi:1,5-anhydro-D-fructose reductase (1,5-anhydro-D-mannitol-forming)